MGKAVRSPKITVTVLSARGLVSQGPKGAAAPVNTFASVLFPSAAEAQTCPVVDNSPEPKYSFVASTDVLIDDATLSSLIFPGVKIQLMESMPNDKLPLGSAVFLSLEPLLDGTEVGEQWMSVGNGAEVLVAASADKQLLTEEQLDDSTVLSVKLEAVHSLPERWLLQEGQSEADGIFKYDVKGTMSIGGGEFSFEGGLLQLPEAPKGDESASNTPRSTAAAPAAVPVGDTDVADTDVAAAPAPTEAESKTPEAKEASSQSIAFPAATPYKVFLGLEAIERLKEAVAAGEPVLSLALSRTVRNAEAHIDPNAGKYRAVCELDLTQMLEIDAVTCTGRFSLRPAPKDEAEEVAEPEVKPDAKPAKGAGKGGKKGKEPETLPLEEEESPHPYESAGTYLRVLLSATKPLSPQPPPPPPPLPPVSELVPRRTLPSLMPKTAATEFQTQISEVIDSLVKEWTSLFPDVTPETISSDDGGAAKEERRKALLYSLNTSGKYYLFKEKLKRSVVRLAKETVRRPTGDPPDAAALHLFHNQLYVTLTQRMHAALDTIFFPAITPPTAPSAPTAHDGTPTAAVLATLANEKESLFNFAAADTYHQERVATNKYDAQAWLEYGLFLMRAQQPAKAEECTREAIALRPDDSAALLAHGCIVATRGDYERAEAFLKPVLDAAPTDVSLWLLMAILFEKTAERRRDVRTALKKATELCSGDEDALGPHYIALARRLLPISARWMAERAVELAEGAQAPAGALVDAQLRLHANQFESVEQVLVNARAHAPKDWQLWALLGHAALRQGKTADAGVAYEKALALSGEPRPIDVLLLAGGVCLGQANFALAREHYLRACKLEPSCSSWLGAGSACLALGAAAEAEECLCEANVLNNRDGAVWAQLSLLCAQQKRVDEAEQALEQALRHGFADASVLSSIGEALFKCGKWALAERAARRATAGDGGGRGYTLLGDALSEQGALDEALDAYKKALDCEDDGAASAKLKETIRTLLSAKLGRHEEAAQYA